MTSNEKGEACLHLCSMSSWRENGAHYVIKSPNSQRMIDKLEKLTVAKSHIFNVLSSDALTSNLLSVDQATSLKPYFKKYETNGLNPIARWNISINL